VALIHWPSFLVQQIAIAEPLANPGETVVSPEAWEMVKYDFQGTPVGTLIAKGQRQPVGDASHHGEFNRNKKQLTIATLIHSFLLCCCSFLFLVLFFLMMMKRLCFLRTSW
jgi:hypothetical protein